MVEMGDARKAACSIHHMVGALDQADAHQLTAVQRIQVIGEGAPQPFRQFGAGKNDAEGIAIPEYEFGASGYMVRIASWAKTWSGNSRIQRQLGAWVSKCGRKCRWNHNAS